MKKDEFLQVLRRALTGNVPSDVIEENIRYYDSYITEEMYKGNSEENVIADIGDPRLIAKTIEDTTDSVGEARYSDVYEDKETQGKNSGYGQTSYGGAGSFHMFNLNKWYWKLLLILIVCAVIFLVVAIVGGLFSLLLPLLGPLLVIWLVVRIIKMFNQ